VRLRYRAAERSVLLVLLILLALFLDPLTIEGAAALILLTIIYVCYVATRGWPIIVRLPALTLSFLVPFLGVPAIFIISRVRSARMERNDGKQTDPDPNPDWCSPRR